MTKMSKVIGIALATTAMFFGSCSNDSGSDNEATSSTGVEFLGIAYPGANLIRWKGGKEILSSITCVRDDGRLMSESGGSFWDYEVEDGEEYTYTIYNGNKRLETASGAAPTITLKAIKPAYIKEDGSRMTALDLTAYENGSYDANASKDGVVTKDNLKVQIDKKDNFVVVSFPKKEYLNYTVTLYKGNSAELLPASLSGANKGSIDEAYKAALIKANKTGLYTSEGKITGSGQYQVVVTVYVQNDFYAAAKVYSSVIPVESVDTASPTGTVKAAFTDNTNAKVRVEWTPAIKVDGKTPYATTNYKVYAYDKDTLEVKEVSESIMSAEKAGDTVYYVDTAVKVDSGKIYKRLCYRVILSDNEKYEDMKGSDSDELVWYSPSEPVADYIYIYPTTDVSTSTLRFRTYSTSLPASTISVKYAVLDEIKHDYSSNDYSDLLITSEHTETAPAFTAVRSIPGDNTSTILYYEAVTSVIMQENTVVAYEITFKESNKKDYVTGSVYK